MATFLYLGDVKCEPWKSFLFFLTTVSPWSEVDSRRGLTVWEKHFARYEVSGTLCLTIEKPEYKRFS